MDFSDERIFDALFASTLEVLAQMLSEVDFSQNTIKLHLKRLVYLNLLAKKKFRQM